MAATVDCWTKASSKNFPPGIAIIFVLLLLRHSVGDNSVNNLIKLKVAKNGLFIYYQTNK